MWTEADKKEFNRLKQKRDRARDTGRRKAMLEWNKGPKGKEALKKYASSEHGKEVMRECRLPGTVSYNTKMGYRKDFRTKAEKSRQRWTAKEELQLVNMRAEGVANVAIAIELKRSLQSIEHKISALKKCL